MPLTLLVTSPRVAPGLMTWSAWQAITTADRVLASESSAPVPRAVTSAGRPVEVLPEPSVDDLLELAGEATVVWLASDAEATTLPRRLAERVVAGDDAPSIEVLHASYDVPGARLLDLVTVMDRLRTGCPWDREQTHASLARYLLEETYETLEAIDNEDHEHLREELGDLLLQVCFHARIASERAGEDAFGIDDVAGDIVDKLVRRHPHVFALAPDADAPSRDEVEESWETLKAAEKGRSSVLEGIPATLPALALADKVLGRAAQLDVTPAEPVDDSLGGRLLALVVEARAAGADPEQELRHAVRRVADAVRAAEGDAPR